MKKILKMVFALFLSFAFVSCGKEEDKPVDPTPAEVTAQRIEIATNPTKVTYEEGEQLDLSGLSVKVIYSDNTDELVMDFTVDKDVLTVNDTKVTVTWNNLTTTFDITVNAKQADPVVNGVEVQVKDGSIYHRGDGVADIIEYRTTSTDGSTGVWGRISEADVKNIAVNGTKVNVSLEFIFREGTFNATCEIPVVEYENLVSVEQFYANLENTEVQYINGIVLGEVCTMRSDEGLGLELLIKDKATEKVVAITNIFGGKQADARSFSTNLHGIEKGDEIVAPVTVKVSTVAEEKGRVLGNYCGGQFIETLVVSKNNPVTISTANAFNILGEEDLKEFFTAPARLDNFYKIVRIDAPYYSHSYGGDFWRTYFDNTYTKNAEANIDGSSVVFLSPNTKYCSGKSFEELIWGDAFNEDFLNAHDAWGEYTEIRKSIYGMYVGGNSYYHILTILDESWVSELTNHEVDKQFVEPTKLVYGGNETLDLTGAKIVTRYNLEANVEVPVTIDMIKESTIPTFKQAGTFKIEGVYEGFEFSFDIEVQLVTPTKVEIINLPTKTEYTHRDTLSTVDLTGGKIKVTFSDESIQEIEMSNEMKPETDNWALGKVTYAMNYEGISFDLDITYVDESLSISDFMSNKEVNEADVHGVIVSVVSNSARAEVILQDPVSKELLLVDQATIWGTAYNNPKLKKGEKGDLIIILLSKTSSLDVTEVDANQFKAFLVGEKTSSKSAGYESYDNMIIVSHENPIVIDFTKAVTVCTEEGIQNVLASDNRVLTIVKFTKGLHIAGKDAAQSSNTQLRLWYGDIETLDSAKHKYTSQTITPIFYKPLNKNLIGDGEFEKYLGGEHSNDVTTPQTFVNDFYAIFVGGSKTLGVFAILDASWILPNS